MLKEVVEAMIEDESFPADSIGFRLAPNSPFGVTWAAKTMTKCSYVAKAINKHGLGKFHENMLREAN